MSSNSSHFYTNILIFIISNLLQKSPAQPGSFPMSQHSFCDAPTPCGPSQACAPPRVRPLSSTHPATVPPCVCTHPAPILQHGCWENTPRHLRHVVVHHNAKFFQVRVRAPNHAVTFDLGKEEKVKEDGRRRRRQNCKEKNETKMGLRNENEKEQI